MEPKLNEKKWVTYGEIPVGQEFALKRFTSYRYMKISSETDHNHFYVALNGASKGNVFGPLMDNDEVLISV